MAIQKYTEKFDLPVTLDRRRYFKTHSVFSAWRSNEHINVIFVHRIKDKDGDKDKDKGKAAKDPISGSFDPKSNVLSIELSSAEYEKLWDQIWREKNPILSVSVKDNLLNKLDQFYVKPG